MSSVSRRECHEMSDFGSSDIASKREDSGLNPLYRHVENGEKFYGTRKIVSVQYGLIRNLICLRGGRFQMYLNYVLRIMVL